MTRNREALLIVATLLLSALLGFGLIALLELGLL